MSEEFSPTMPLSKASDLVMKLAWKEVLECPCCTQVVKVYGRTITYGMKVALSLIASASGPDAKWVHARETVHAMGYKVPGVYDYGKLKYWGLIESLDDVDPVAKLEARSDGNSGTGLWRMTRQGWMFLTGRTEVPIKKFVFNDTVLKNSDELVAWSGIESEKFDWNELMLPAIQLPTDLNVQTQTQLSLI